VIALRRPPDYKTPQGARFELHIEKARALAGHDLEPIEARLRVDAEGRANWVWPIELQDNHRVAARLTAAILTRSRVSSAFPRARPTGCARR
jgi:putative DNA primase/helicase